MTDGLTGRRILIVEDEPIIAMSLEDMLRDLGCTVVGPALRLPEAERMAREEEIDGAILDVNLGGGQTFRIADILVGRGVPFCFSTGYGAAAIPAHLEAAPVLQKPYREESLAEILRRCLACE